MPLVTDGGLRVEPVLVFRVLSQRPERGGGLHPHDAPAVHVRKRGQPAVTEQLLCRVEAYLGLFLVNGGGIHLGGRLPVEKKHIESDDRRECCLTILPRDIDVGILVTASLCRLAIPAEHICGDEQLPVLQPYSLSGKLALEMLQRLSETDETQELGGVKVQIRPFLVILVPFASEPHHPTGWNRAGYDVRRIPVNPVQILIAHPVHLPPLSG